MESFEQGYRIGQNDLIFNLYARYNNSSPNQSFPYTPFNIKYDVCFIHPTTNQLIPVRSVKRLPFIISTGRFCPDFIIGEDWAPGIYEVRWYYTATETSDVQMTAVQFSVTSFGIRQYRQTMANHFDVHAFIVLTE